MDELLDFFIFFQEKYWRLFYLFENGYFLIQQTNCYNIQVEVKQNLKIMTPEHRYDSYEEKHMESIDRFPQQFYHKHHHYSFDNDETDDIVIHAPQLHSPLTPQKGFKILNEIRKQLAQIDSKMHSHTKTQIDNNESSIHLSPYSGEGIGSKIQQNHSNEESNFKSRYNDVIITSPKKDSYFEKNRKINLNDLDHDRKINLSFQYPKNESLDPEKFRKVDIKVNIQPKHYEKQQRVISTKSIMNANYLHQQPTHSRFKPSIQKQDHQLHINTQHSHEPHFHQNHNHIIEDSMKNTHQIQDIQKNKHTSNPQQNNIQPQQKQYHESKCLLLNNNHKNINIPKCTYCNSYYEQYMRKTGRKSTVSKSKPKSNKKSTSKSPKKNESQKMNYQSRYHKNCINSSLNLTHTPNKASRLKNSTLNSQKLSFSPNRDAKVNYPPSSPYYQHKKQSKQKRISTNKINYNSNYGKKDVIELKSQINELESKINKQYQQSVQGKKDISKSGKYTYFMNNQGHQNHNFTEKRVMNSKEYSRQCQNHIKLSKQYQLATNKFSNQNNEQSYYNKLSSLSPKSQKCTASKPQFRAQLVKNFLVNHYLKQQDIDRVYKSVCHNNIPQQQWIISALNEVYKKQLTNIKSCY